MVVEIEGGVGEKWWWRGRVVMHMRGERDKSNKAPREKQGLKIK